MEDNPSVFADILMQRKTLRDQPHVVLKFKADTPVRKKKLNDFLKQLNQKGEEIRFNLAKGVDAGIYFAMIYLT